MPKGDGEPSAGEKRDARAEHAFGQKIGGDNCQYPQNGRNDAKGQSGLSEKCDADSLKINEKGLATIISNQKDRPFAIDDLEGIETIEGLVGQEATRDRGKLVKSKKDCDQQHDHWEV